jgi:S-DNA-T family DNA segregation ATPase FtsK/SpoIIIE
LCWGACHRRSFFIILLGFIVVLLASSTLESLRFLGLIELTFNLPSQPGGMLGSVLGGFPSCFLLHSSFIE